MGDKRFEACVLRINDKEYVVVEWNQLVTVMEKSKLSIGSSVGYRKSKDKREKITRGEIVSMGSLKVCQQQKTLFMSRHKRTRKANEIEVNEGEDDNGNGYAFDLNDESELEPESEDSMGEENGPDEDVDDEVENSSNEAPTSKEDRTMVKPSSTSKDNRGLSSNSTNANSLVKKKSTNGNHSSTSKKEGMIPSSNKKQVKDVSSSTSKKRVESSSDKETTKNGRSSTSENRQSHSSPNNQKNNVNAETSLNTGQTSTDPLLRVNLVNLVSPSHRTNDSNNQRPDPAACQSDITVASPSDQLDRQVPPKRKAADDDEPSTYKRSLISLAQFEEVKRENHRLKREIDGYKSKYMPRPIDLNVIKYFVRIGEILSINDGDSESKGDRLAMICDKLRMNEDQLDRLHKPNGTKTARSIVRFLYPPDARSNVGHEDIDPEIRHAIHQYVHIHHGMEGLSEGRINESINNVFRSAKRQQKEKNTKQKSSQSSDLDE